MITKEKHFTKCETPNSSRIVEDKKHANSRLMNGIVDVGKFRRGGSEEGEAVKRQEKAEKAENVEERPTAEEKNVNGSEDDKATSGDEAPGAFSAPKLGTVIPNRIFVGGFTAKTADEDLWRFFSSFSHITAAKIIYDRAGVSKCYGFVTFGNPKDAKVIVKQSGGVMFSPMGRLRIAQAVRKQAPHYQSLPPEFAQMGLPAPPEGYLAPQPHVHQPKTPVCLAYPVAVQSQHRVATSPHCVQAPSPATNPDPGVSVALAQQLHRRQRATPPGAYTSDGGVYQGSIVGPPPTYVMGVPYAASLPAYDATGLYTTCPGYAQAPGCYPYAMLLPQARELPTFAASYAPAPLGYGPPPPAACYAPDPHHKMPLINSYIY